MRRRRFTVSWWFAGVLLAVPPVNGDSVPNDLPEASTVIRHLIERAGLHSISERTGNFAFYRTNITEEYNGTGKLRERREMVKRIVYQNGERSTRLILFNGRAPTQEELSEAAEEDERRREGKDHKDVPDRSRQINHFVTTAMLSRFIFEVVGRQEVQGRPCLMVTFRPAPDQEPPEKFFDRVINRLGGIIWVDEQEAEMVKAEIQLREKTTLWAGFLASLDRISLKILRTRLDDGFWVDQEVEARFTGRALTRHIDIQTWDFASAPTSIETQAFLSPAGGVTGKPGIDSAPD